MPLRFSSPAEDSDLPAYRDPTGPSGRGRQLPPSRGAAPPSLIALPPAPGAVPHRPRGPGRLFAAVAAIATVTGIAVFSFGMKYQPRTAPGLVDLVEKQSRAGEPEDLPAPVLEGTAPASAQNTFFVHVGPYKERAAILTDYLRLRKLGYEATLIPGDDGARLQVIHTTDEREAQKVAKRLFDRGMTPALFGTDPPAAMLRSIRASSVQYGPVGIKIGFEGGRTTGWSSRGTAVGTRNSALFSANGSRSMEVLLQNTNSESPAQARNGSLSVVLPGDCFTVRVLQPVWSARPVTAFLFVTDAEKRVYKDMAISLEPGQWIELKHTISQQVALPLKEIGIQFGGDLPYTGPIYVDEVEQKRPQ